MPWESDSIASVAPSRSPCTKRNAGVLEAKMKLRLQQDQDAVAIGAITSPQHQRPSKKKARHNQKLPRIEQISIEDSKDRPHSFENQRVAAMDAADLPSPTRSLIQKHVLHVKETHQQDLARLPPIAGAYKKRNAAHSLFPQAYQRGELPIMVESKTGGKTIRWTQDIKTLDYSKYFPLFLEGIKEPAYPYHFLAREGAFQLLRFGRDYPERVLDCLSRIITALRSILETRDSKHLRDALFVLQELAQIPGIGPALVPFYRQLLPVISMFKGKRRNLGDTMDFKQNSLKDVSEMVRETLELLERTGGPDAFVNIKYMVPTYEGVRQGGG
ncbi:hypothetical protein Poli38472_004486 [Pythium oligandrum]|uniref:Uncharacterized protein n=1 Tax=Pythium oligandrum TaxID=41045 RepID=A0A8K1FH67_PYTOL|nr:hypothetical protein Poli38472_004486 [Pythium oligandrum]|eukprot:TMW59417.1 hypothetical protein Poli38472_004486 [Pythium oligandrum]